MLSGTLGVSLLGNLWIGNDKIKAGKKRIRAGEGRTRAGHESIIRTNLNLMVLIQEIIYLK